MHTKIKVELVPFKVPNFVIAMGEPGAERDGLMCSMAVSLSELDSETLNVLCSDFRAEVFKKAGVLFPDTAED